MAIDLTNHDLQRCALALAASARGAEIDERPLAAAADYRLAARLYQAAGFPQHALQQLVRAQRAAHGDAALGEEDAS